MIYEQTILWPQAFMFSVHSCSSLSHSTRRSCLGRHSFTELRQIFLQLGVWFGQRFVFKWNLDTNTKHYARGNTPVLLQRGKKKKIQHINLTELRHCIQCNNMSSGVLTAKFLDLIDNVLIWVTVWQVQKTRGTGGRAALTSARPGNVDAPCCTSWPASSQGEAKERSTWVGWVLSPLFFFFLKSSWRVPFYLPSKKMNSQELLRHAVPSILSLNY